MFLFLCVADIHLVGIAAGSKCRYTERDIKGYLDRYAKDSDITEVWVWYEQTSGNSYEVYIGYA